MKALKIWRLGLLSMVVAGCGRQLDVAPEIPLKHKYDAAMQRQIELLQAEQVRVMATAATPGGPALPVLTLEVINPQPAPEQQPDTLKQRMHKLAHLLVADLARPGQYQAISAQATFKTSFFSRSSGASASSQVFIYSIASLR
ncbi:hypothetical protein GCM10027422_09950 [Hymenobacter arcticus]